MKDFQRQMITNQGRPMTGVYDKTEDQEFMLGTLFKTNEGDVFRYAKAGATDLDQGHLTQATVPIANHTNIATGVVVAKGATEFTFVTNLATAVTEDQYRDGWLLVNDEAGEGHIYRIKSNTADDDNPTIYLWDPIAVALTAASEVSLIANPWNGSIVVPNTGASAANNGCPLVAVDGGEYYWSKVRGPAPVMGEGSLVDGNNVRNSEGSVAGAVAPAADTDAQQLIVGHVMSTLTGGDYSLINLIIE